MTDSLDRAAMVVGELASDVRRLTEEVVRSERIRENKIRAIQKAMFVVVPALVLLVVLAFTNFVLLARVRDAANSAKNTNALIAGCLQPGTECSNASAQKTAEAITQLRQTQFVIAICQRQNPVTEDPNGTKIVSCVQRYYPGFRLPPQVK